MNILRAIQVNHNGYQVESPDECPVCHHHSEIQIIQSDQVEQGAGVQVIYRCAFSGCRSYFIGFYGPMPEPRIKAIRPIKPNPSSFSDQIKTLSPTFIEVFREAEEAGHLGLSQVSGPAYRKSFEFLIKDYAKMLAPGKESDIENKFSGAVVNEYISDTRIQAVAKRCLWLGNDESHYLKKWTDHDISDLITLIKLTTHWIDIEQLSKSYIDSMPEHT